MRVLLIDNYDSFTWNLFQLLRSCGVACNVRTHDSVTIEEIRLMKPDRIVISPGPGAPRDAGISCEVVRAFAGKIPILGVCLGHQCIAEVFGTRVIHAPNVMHGKTSEIFHTGSGLFRGIPSPFPAARYHSLIVDRVPQEFSLTAWTGTATNQGLIMGITHTTLPIFGIQFHPESFLTSNGEKLIKNFLSLKR